MALALIGVGLPVPTCIRPGPSDRSRSHGRRACTATMPCGGWRLRGPHHRSDGPARVTLQAAAPGSSLPQPPRASYPPWAACGSTGPYPQRAYAGMVVDGYGHGGCSHRHRPQRGNRFLDRGDRLRDHRYPVGGSSTSRRRAKVRVEATIAGWPTAAEAIGLPGRVSLRWWRWTCGNGTVRAILRAHSHLRRGRSSARYPRSSRAPTFAAWTRFAAQGGGSQGTGDVRTAVAGAGGGPGSGYAAVRRPAAVGWGGQERPSGAVAVVVPSGWPWPSDRMIS